MNYIENTSDFPFAGSLQQQQSTYQLDHERMVSVFTQNKDEEGEEGNMLSEEQDQINDEKLHQNIVNLQQVTNTREYEYERQDSDLKATGTPNLEQQQEQEKKRKEVGFACSHNSSSVVVVDDNTSEVEVSFDSQIQTQKKNKEEEDQIPNKSDYFIKKFIDKQEKKERLEDARFFERQKAFVIDENDNILQENNQNTANTPQMQNMKISSLNDKINLSLYVMLKVKIVIQRFLSLLNKEKFKMLRKFHFAVINDALLTRQQTEYHYTKQEETSGYQRMLNDKYQSKKKGITVQLKKFVQKYNLRELKRFLKMVSKYQILVAISDSIPLFSPSGIFATLWNISQAAIILQQFIQIPLFIVFGDVALQMFGKISTVIFSLQMMDILVQLNMKCYQKGSPVKDRFKIFIRYLKENALIDTLGIGPVLYKFLIYEQGTIKYAFGETNHLILLIYYFKLTHLNRQVKKIEQSFYMRNLDYRSFVFQAIQFIKLLIKIIVITHMFCCIWIYAAKYEYMQNQSNPITWIDKYVISDFINGIQSQWYEIYLVAYYFSTVTMVTVGYGDIKPNTQLEILLSIITIMISCCVFAYCLNCVGSILSENNKHQEKLQKQMMIMNKYMSKKAISFDLQYQIREYLEWSTIFYQTKRFYCTELMNQNYQEKQVIDVLNEQLQEQLMVEANNIVIEQSSIFKNNFSQNVLKNTIKLIKEMRLTPKDVVYQQGDLDDQYIYFIEEGKVELYFQSRQGEKSQTQNMIKFGELTKGQSFGNIEFFTNQPRNVTIKCKDFNTLLFIKRSEFIEMIKQHPSDYEKFCMLKDRLLNYQQYELIGNLCISCYSVQHFTNDCPLLSYKPNNLLIINSGKNLKQVRRKFERVKKVKIGLNDLYDVQENLECFIDSNYSFLENLTICNFDEYDGETDNEIAQKLMQQPSNQDHIQNTHARKSVQTTLFDKQLENHNPTTRKSFKGQHNEEKRISLLSHNNRLSIQNDLKNNRGSIQMKHHLNDDQQGVDIQINSESKSPNEFPIIEIEKTLSFNKFLNDQNIFQVNSLLFPKSGDGNDGKNPLLNSLDKIKNNLQILNEAGLYQFKTLEKKIQNIFETMYQNNLDKENHNNQQKREVINNCLEMDVMKNFQNYFIEGNSDDIIKVLQYKSKKRNNMKQKIQFQDSTKKAFYRKATFIDKFKQIKILSEQSNQNKVQKNIPKVQINSSPQNMLKTQIVSFGQS